MKKLMLISPRGIIFIALCCLACFNTNAQTQVNAKNDLSCDVILNFVAYTPGCTQVAAAMVTLPAGHTVVYNIASLPWVGGPVPPSDVIAAVRVGMYCSASVAVGNSCTGLSNSGTFSCSACGPAMYTADWTYTSGPTANLHLH